MSPLQHHSILARLLTAMVSLLILVAVTIAALAQSPTNPSSPPSESKPVLPPGIFAVGFTNITNSSARLVFTTSEAMSSTVVVLDQDKEIARLHTSAFEEIHSTDLTGLVKGKSYQITIIGTTEGGQTVTSDHHLLTPQLRPPSSHAWPGYTIFSTSVSGPANAEALDLLTQSGARMVRVEVSWDGLFPQRGEINQKYLDAFLHEVSDLKARNIEPLVILDYCVPWAKTYTDTTMTWRHPAFGPPDDLNDWESYVRTVVTALHGNARYYEVWNEPDAGYLATGRFVERPDMPAPIGRPPFKDNLNYWMGDRYAPMISRVRQVLDEIQPDALMMNGGWNRDYTGQRGDILFQRGVAPYLDLYAFHCYSAQPLSFSRWYAAIDGGFRSNIDRIFTKHNVKMPLAVTEWGWPAWGTPPPGKGFVSFEDAQKFLVKSTFYFLSQQRFEILSQFCLGIGPDTRDKDPLFFMLANRSSDGHLVIQPPFGTFEWLATTFGSRAYQPVVVEVTPSEQVKAYAIQMKDSGDTYLAVWQDGVPDANGAIASQPARDVEVTLSALEDGTYSVQPLNLDGKAASPSSTTSDHPLHLKITLPEISSTSESGIYLAKISRTPR